MRSLLSKLLSTAELLPSASTRKFYRTKQGIIFVGNKVQINEYLKFHQLLSNLDLPQVVEQHDEYLIIEDLGPERLDKIIDPPYKMVIDELIKWQKATETKAKKLEVFSYSHLRWEYEYFLEYTLYRYFKIEPSETLIKKFDYLAQQIDRIPKTLMHRDFQSRNIFIKDGRIRIIDFQNAVIGPATYDLASLLFDPYRPIAVEGALELLTYYNEQSDFEFSPEKLYISAVQRLLQALGAYAFLTLFRKKNYRQYLKIGTDLLKGILDKYHFPNLMSVVDEILKKID